MWKGNKLITSNDLILKCCLIVVCEIKTQCFHGNYECCLPSVNVAPEADNQRRLRCISIIYTLETSPFHSLMLSCFILPHSSNSPVGHIPFPSVCRKENKFPQSNLSLIAQRLERQSRQRCQSPADLLSSLPLPHSITPIYVQFNYNGAEALFIS